MVSEVGAFMREFCNAEIWTWKMMAEGEFGDKTRFTVIIILNNSFDWTLLPRVLQTKLSLSIFDQVWYLVHVCARYCTTPYTLLLCNTI